MSRMSSERPTSSGMTSSERSGDRLRRYESVPSKPMPLSRNRSRSMSKSTTRLLEFVGVIEAQPATPPKSPRATAFEAQAMSRVHSFEYWASRVEFLEEEDRAEAVRKGTDELEAYRASWSPSISRKDKRYHRQELLIIGTMERLASQRLQIVIENHRELREFYDVDKKLLGKGSFGTVTKCSVRASGATRAVKKVSKKQIKETIGLLKREISITKMTDHPNIVKLYEIFEDRSYIYFVMELCSGGTLQSHLKNMGRLQETGVGGAAAVMMQVFRGVYYLHKSGICHRDLKPENFLFTAPEDGDANNLVGCLRIADFGISCTFEPGQTLTSLAGTYAYMAPEVLDKCYNEVCDLWSCGVILYECLCGYTPFSGPDSKTVCKKVRAGKFGFVAADWADATTKVAEFVKDLLRKDYTKRVNIEQALKHPWLECHPSRPTTQPLSLPLIESLKAFRKLNKFKRAALHVIASLLRDDQIAVSREAFNALDVDGNGSLDVGELRMALERSYPQIVQEVLRLFEDEKWGVVAFSYTEFIAATFRLKDFDEKICRAAFQTFDHTGDGFISTQEIRSGSVLGILRGDDLDQLLREFDLDGDGQIDFQEFKDMLSTSIGADIAGGKGPQTTSGGNPLVVGGDRSNQPTPVPTPKGGRTPPADGGRAKFDELTPPHTPRSPISPGAGSPRSPSSGLKGSRLRKSAVTPLSK